MRTLRENVPFAASSSRNGMGDERVPDERRRDQVDDVAGPAASAADRHRSATRDAPRMHAEPRRRCGESPHEHDRSCDHYDHDDESAESRDHTCIMAELRTRLLAAPEV